LLRIVIFAPIAQRKSISMKQYTEKTLKEAVKVSLSYKMVLDKFERNASSSAYKTLKKKIKEWNIDTSHFLGRKEMANYLYQTKSLSKRGYKDIFVVNSTVARSVLRNRIVKDKLISYTCSMCPLDDNWNGKKISLILDHINGIRNDNRLENLRFLCPNCNATLPTHCKGGYN